MESAVIIDKTFQGAVSHNIEDYPGGLIIPVDKPYRWTSGDVVRKLKFALQKHFGVKNIKIGHAGTLDPLATGLLIVCAGKATKLAETIQSHEKEYIAGISIGATTPSFDLEKPIDCFYPYEHIDAKAVEECCRQFVGEQEQVPPMFSAKYINGTRAYEYARDGKEMPLKSSRITIYEAELLDFDPAFRADPAQSPIREATAPSSPAPEVEDSPRPLATVRILCSKGTYIRSFARDLGLALGSGAYLNSLQRTICGNFSIKNANSLDNLLSTNYFCRLN
ncbi:MAG: tRNA pseudouridine(55) synthase TruB [Bacteroidales bacterium]|nr:tRNA pseudouridine(55) synthase TruB [Bacteroidales bacterium]